MAYCIGNILKVAERAERQLAEPIADGRTDIGAHQPELPYSSRVDYVQVHAQENYRLYRR